MVDKIIPSALRIWLAFLIILVLLGYSVVISIIFGAIAGFAGGMISAWWRTPGGAPSSDMIPDSIRQFGQQIKATPSRLPFLKLFNRRDKRYSRTKR